MLSKLLSLRSINISLISNYLQMIRKDGIACKLFLNSASVLNQDSFVFYNFANYFWYIVSFSLKYKLFYLMEVFVVGLGYRVRHTLVNIFRIFLGRSNYVYIFGPKNLIVKAYSNDATKSRKLMIIGLDKTVVNNFSAFLFLLKLLSPYRITGMLDKRYFIVLKTGKRR